MSCSPTSFAMVIGSVVVVLVVLFTHGPTCLVEASVFATEQASSSNSNNMADKEIAFISVNGNLLNDKNSSALIQNTNINATQTETENVSAAESKRVKVLKRGKRYLDLLKTTRMFFRANAKNNIIPKPVIWAHGFGFRCNYPIDNDIRVRPFRRDTYETLGELMDKNGFDGKACILKAFCAAHLDESSEINKGILFKLLKFIFTLNDDDRRHFSYLKHENCAQILHSHCPLSFNNISPFTDDV